jgi:hypothetical protein
MSGQANLFEVILALCPCRSVANLLHRRHQEADQDCDDRYDHQQFDQRETSARCF